MSCGLDPNTTPDPPQAYRSNAFCSDPSVVKYVRLAYHFILTDEAGDLYNLPIGDEQTIPVTAPGNFTPYGDGLGNSDYTGYDRAHEITDTINLYLANNHPHWREADGVSYPANPPEINLQFVVSAVQFHTNSADWQYGYGFSSNKYDYGGNDVIDIYMLPYFNNSTSGVVFGLGVANKYLTVASYGSYVNPSLRAWSKRYMPGLIIHELGHTLYLNHTWNANDQCTDTPRGYIYEEYDDSQNMCIEKEANCAAFNDTLCPCPDPGSNKPCDNWSKITNNYMDYNGYYYVHALTECQIGLIQGNLNTYDGYIHSCNNCLPATSYFEVENTCLYSYLDRFGQPVTGGVQINANASYNVDQWYLEICELNTNGNCTGSTYTSPWQSGSPSQMIMTDYFAFQPNKYYRIILTTNKSTCPLNESFQKDLLTIACSSTANPDIDITGGSTIFSTSLSVTYSLNTTGTVDLYAVNTATGISFDLLTNHVHIAAGSKSFDFNTTSIPQGTYQIVGIFESSGWGNQISVDTKAFIKN